MEIFNLDALRQKPEILYLNGVPSELPRWASIEDRQAHARARLESSALTGMAPEALHIYFARHSFDAIQSWNRQQSLFGQLLNRLIMPRPGYAKISGRVLRQFYDALDVQANEAFMISAELYLRADIVAEIAALTQQKGPDR